MNKEEKEQKKVETDDVYEKFNKEVLKKLEKEHGKQWTKDNWKMLEKDRKFFESMNLL